MLGRNIFARELLVIFSVMVLFSLPIISSSVSADIFDPERNVYGGFGDPGGFLENEFISEAVSPANGVLTLSATDIYLPCRNGLDVNVNRIYRSNVWVDPGNGFCKGDEYPVTFPVYGGDPDGRRYGKLVEPSSFGLGWDFQVGEIQLQRRGENLNQIRFFDDNSWISLGDGIRHEIGLETETGPYFVKDQPDWQLIYHPADEPPYYTPHMELRVEDGTKYVFAKGLQIGPSAYFCEGLPYAMYTTRFWCTKIEDTNGNYQRITYYPNNTWNPVPSFAEASEGVFNSHRMISKITDTMNRDIDFNIVIWEETPGNPDSRRRIYIESMQYYDDDLHNIVIKFFYDKLFPVTYGYFLDSGFRWQLENQTIVLDSVAYCMVVALDDTVQLEPAVRFEYDSNFGVLKRVNYPNGGATNYKYARVLKEEYPGSGYNVHCSGFIRLIEKSLETPGNTTPEIWKYEYAGPSGPYDSFTDDYGVPYDDPNHPVSLDLPSSSVGDFIFFQYFPNYCRTRVTTPSSDSTIYHFFNETEPPNSQEMDFIGLLDSARTYSKQGELLSSEITYYDRSNGVGRSYYDSWTGVTDQYYNIRKIGERTFDGSTQYFTDYYEFNEYEMPHVWREWGEVNSVSWSSGYPETGRFVIDEDPEQMDDFRSHAVTYLWETNNNYENLHILTPVTDEFTYNRGGFLIEDVATSFDDFPIDQQGWSLPGWNSTMTQYRANLTKQTAVNQSGPSEETWYYFNPVGQIVEKVLAPNESQARHATYDYSGTFYCNYLTGYTIDPATLNLYASLTYDYMGQLEQYTDYNNNTTSYDYDYRGRPLWVDFPNNGGSGRSIEYEYTDHHTWYEVVKKIKLTAGQPSTYMIEKYFIDAAGRIGQHQRIDADSAIVFTHKYWHDGSTRSTLKPIIVLRTSGDPFYNPPSGLDSIRYHYDALGRLDTTDYTFINFLTRRQKTTKDFNSNTVILTDEEGKITREIYGARGVLNETNWGTEPNLKRAYFSHDPLDRLTHVSLSNDPTEYNYIYDELGNLIESSMSDQDEPNLYRYNSAGQVIFMQDPERRHDTEHGWIYNKYDKAGRITETGLVGLSGECEPEVIEVPVSVEVLATPTQFHDETFTDPICRNQMGQWSAYFGEVPLGTNPGYYPEILRTRYFKIFKVLPGGGLELKRRTSVNRTGTIELEEGVTYKLEIFDDGFEFAGGELTYTCKEITDCEPNYSYPQQWRKRYYYDSYTQGVQIPTGLNNPKGNLTKVKVNNVEQGTVDSSMYFCDSRNRIGETWEGIAELGAMKHIHYNYNEANLVTQITYPNNNMVTYDHNEYGLIYRVGDNILATRDKYATFIYTPTLKPKTLYLGPVAVYAQKMDYAYNPERDWLTNINDAGSVIADEFGRGDHYAEIIRYYSGGYENSDTFGVYLNGDVAAIKNIFSSHQGWNPNREAHYGYDSRDRLTNVFVSTGSPYNETFTYYDFGKINQYTRGTSSTQTYNYYLDQNRLSHISPSQPSNNYEFNYRGEVVSDNQKGVDFTWDYRNLPIQALFSNPANFVKYKYDASDKRIKKHAYYAVTGANQITYYIYSGDDPIMEFYGNGNVKNVDIYANGILIARRGYSSTEPCVLAQNCPTFPTVPPHCEPDEPDWVCGDVNGNGYCNGIDVTFLIAYLQGIQRAPFPLSRGDVNNSGTTDGIDVTYLVNFFKGPPNPSPLCSYHTCGMLYYHVLDHLGSTRALIDSAGRMYAAYDYYAYGEKTDKNWEYESGSDYQYVGKPFDDESGLNLSYLGARYLDSKAFVFTSIEPLLLGSMAGTSGGLENYYRYLFTPYSYAGNNPLAFRDADGNIWQYVIATGVALAAGAGAAWTLHELGETQKQIVMVDQEIRDTRIRLSTLGRQEDQAYLELLLEAREQLGFKEATLTTQFGIFTGIIGGAYSALSGQANAIETAIDAAMTAKEAASPTEAGQELTKGKKAIDKKEAGSKGKDTKKVTNGKKPSTSQKPAQQNTQGGNNTKKKRELKKSLDPNPTRGINPEYAR